MTKIGFLRFNLPVEIDVLRGSTSLLGTEIRMGLIHDWLKLGYEVTIYSRTRDFAKKSKTTLFDFGDEDNKPNDLWWDKIKVESESTDIDADVLWIENSQPVTIYGDYIPRTLDVISRYEGNIIYHHHGDPAFAFPFGDSLTEPTSENELNLRVLFRKYNIWKNKNWKVLAPVHNMERFKEICKGRSKISYKELENKGLVEFDYIPAGHSEIEPHFPVSPNPTYDALWIGGQNTSNKNNGGSKDSRYELVKKYYGSGLYKTAIIGDWQEQIPNARMFGVMGRHGDAYRYWNDSYVCIHGASPAISSIGLQVTRPIMALHGGAIVLADSGMYGVERDFDKKYIVNSSEECALKIKEIKYMSQEERNVYRIEQLKKFPEWKDLNWQEIFS